MYGGAGPRAENSLMGSRGTKGRWVAPSEDDRQSARDSLVRALDEPSEPKRRWGTLRAQRFRPSPVVSCTRTLACRLNRVNRKISPPVPDRTPTPPPSGRESHDFRVPVDPHGQA